MAEALENAYLILLGQIALVLSAIVFGVPFFFSNPDAPNLFHPATLLFLAFAFFASVMMVANIIIGWAALRGSLETKEHYTIRMFVVDVLIVLTFFLMNNAILFSFGGTLSFDKVANLREMLDKGVPLETVAFLSAALYILTAVFLSLCKWWNNLYYKVSGNKNNSKYEPIMWFIIVIDLISGALAIFYSDRLIIQIVLMVIWLSTWVYINGHWLSLDIFKPSRVNPMVQSAGAPTTTPPAVETKLEQGATKPKNVEAPIEPAATKPETKPTAPRKPTSKRAPPRQRNANRSPKAKPKSPEKE